MSSCSFTLASNCSLMGCSDLHFELFDELLYGWQFTYELGIERLYRAANVYSPNTQQSTQKSALFPPGMLYERYLVA